VSYSETSEVETPEIITLAAKPEGLVPGQTKIWLLVTKFLKNQKRYF
jgi:hypothetical protein